MKTINVKNWNGSCFFWLSSKWTSSKSYRWPYCHCSMIMVSFFFRLPVDVANRYLRAAFSQASMEGSDGSDVIVSRLTCSSAASSIGSDDVDPARPQRFRRLLERRRIVSVSDPAARKIKEQTNKQTNKQTFKTQTKQKCQPMGGSADRRPRLANVDGSDDADWPSGCERLAAIGRSIFAEPIVSPLPNLLTHCRRDGILRPESRGKQPPAIHRRRKLDGEHHRRPSIAVEIRSSSHSKIAWH